MPGPASVRTRSLDGLRGLAALAVLISHSLIVFPELLSIHSSGRPIRATWSFEWWIAHTPLHLFWMGTVSVYVFLILSGIVLTLPVLRTKNFSWLAYYPRRLIRLYLPVWASLLLAAVIATVGVRLLPAATALDVLNSFLTPIRLLRDAALVTGVSHLNAPLWSLQWEMLFSLLLPAYVVFAVRWRKFRVVKLLVILGSVLAGSTVLVPVPFFGASLAYLPMFALGALIATELESIRAVATRIDLSSAPRAIWFAVSMLGAFLASAYWIVLAFSPPMLLLNSMTTVSFVGAGILVLVAIFNPAVRSFLELAPLQSLGKYSFSVYLVHAPILIVLNVLLGPDLRIFVLVIGVPTAYLVAAVFYRLVEAPSHRLAKRTAERISAFDRQLVAADPGGPAASELTRR